MCTHPLKLFITCPLFLHEQLYNVAFHSISWWASGIGAVLDIWVTCTQREIHFVPLCNQHFVCLCMLWHICHTANSATLHLRTIYSLILKVGYSPCSVSNLKRLQCTIGEFSRGIFLSHFQITRPNWGQRIAHTMIGLYRCLNYVR